MVPGGAQPVSGGLEDPRQELGQNSETCEDKVRPKYPIALTKVQLEIRETC